MLKSIKKGLTKTIVFVVGGLIILSFAITGVPGPQNIAQRSALKVGDKVYSANELQREFNREVQNRRLQSDTTYTQADAIGKASPCSFSQICEPVRHWNKPRQVWVSPSRAASCATS